MVYLIVAAVLSLVFGVLCLITPASFWSRLNSFFNKSVVNLEDRMHGVNAFLIGVACVMLGIWIVYVALKLVELQLFYYLGSAIIIIGLILIFAPVWLLWISKESGREILSVDKYLESSRISLGIILILAAVYIFLRILMMLKLM